MRFLPEFLTGKFWRKQSENFIRASERAKLRQAEGVSLEGLFPNTSENRGTASEKPVSRFSGLDVKTLVMAVSLIVNAWLAGVLYGKSAATEENELLKKEVSSLRVEKAKMSRASEGKITLAPNQRIITVEEINKFTTSAQETVDSARALFSRVLELEGRLAKYEGKKRASAVEIPTVEVADSHPTGNAVKYSKAIEAVKSVSGDLLEGVSLKVSQNAGLTAVTYSDTSGFYPVLHRGT